MNIVINNKYTIEGTLAIDDSNIMTIVVNSTDDISGIFNEDSTGMIYTIDDDDAIKEYCGYIIVTSIVKSDDRSTVTLRKGTIEECIDHIYKLCNKVMWMSSDSLGSINSSVVQNDRLMLKSILGSISQF